MRFDQTIILSAGVCIVWMILINAARRRYWTTALLYLPGTVAHELAHAGIAFILLAKPVSFNIFPKRYGDQWILGSAAFMNLNIINAFPVAFAPLLLGWLSWLLFQDWMVPAFTSHNYFAWLAFGYLSAVTLFSCVPSLTDVKAGALSAVVWGIAGYGIWKLIVF